MSSHYGFLVYFLASVLFSLMIMMIFVFFCHFNLCWSFVFCVLLMSHFNFSLWIMWDCCELEVNQVVLDKLSQCQFIAILDTVWSVQSRNLLALTISFPFQPATIQRFLSVRCLKSSKTKDGGAREKVYGNYQATTYLMPWHILKTTFLLSF